MPTNTPRGSDPISLILFSVLGTMHMGRRVEPSAHVEAKRLLAFLEGFVPLDLVPETSIMREFPGVDSEGFYDLEK